MYYKNTVHEIRKLINDISPNLKPIQFELIEAKRVPFNHILWMCDKIEKMDISFFDEAIKAARWIGWVLAHMELTGTWNNKQSRDLVRIDRKLGFDKPHHS